MSVQRPGVRAGHDRWATSYDGTPNPLVALDRRYTMDPPRPGPGERILVFSVFHPAMAAADVEANFQREGVEYRLGAHRHTVDDYLGAIEDAGFSGPGSHSFTGDAALVAELPSARRYLGQPLLLAVEARS
jgi:hypothetical protein